MIALVAALIGSLLGPGIYLALTAIADRSAKRRDKGTLGSVHESGGAEGNRPNSVGHLLHKRSD